jgi:protein TonB
VPAAAEGFGSVAPRERLRALVAVAIVQAALGYVLLSGLNVDMLRRNEFVSRLIDITLPPPPPPPRIVQPPPKPKKAPAQHASPKAAAPPPKAANPGGSPGPAPHGNAVIARVPVRATPAAPAGGGFGTGASQGMGAGGGTGTGGTGEGGDEGGTDLEHIAGEIGAGDYPPDLGRAGIGGRVGVLLAVGTNGRVTRCTILRSSRVPQLDALTCRLMHQRFVFRPSTDSRGRPIADEVEWDHDWIPPRR